MKRPRTRNRAFSLLLAGSSVSMVGSRVTTIAYPMLALYLTGSPVDAGLVACAATAPSIICYLPAGAVVDFLDPKRLLMLSEFGRGATIASVVTMVWLGYRSLPLLLVLAVAEKILEVFSTLAERRYVGSLLETEQVSPAMSRVEARTHVAILVGRPLGGLLFEMAPIAPFLFDAATFVGSVGALGIKRRQPAKRHATIVMPIRKIGIRTWLTRTVTRLDQPPKLHMKNDIRKGLDWLWHDQFARTANAVLASSTLISQALIIFFIAEARAQHLPTVAIGFVLAMSGFGGALGSMLASRPPAPFSDFWIRIQMLAWSAAVSILAIFGAQSPVRMGIVMFIFGLTGAMSNIEVDTYIIRHVPGNMLARATSICRLISLTACAIGPVLGGLLFEMHSPQIIAYSFIGVTAVLAAFSMISPSMRIPDELNANAARKPASLLEMIVGWQLSGLAFLAPFLAVFAQPSHPYPLHSGAMAGRDLSPGPHAELLADNPLRHEAAALGRAGQPAHAGAELAQA